MYISQALETSVDSNISRFSSSQENDAATVNDLQ